MLSIIEIGEVLPVPMSLITAEWEIDSSPQLASHGLRCDTAKNLINLSTLDVTSFVERETNSVASRRGSRRTLYESPNATSEFCSCAEAV